MSDRQTVEKKIGVSSFIPSDWINTLEDHQLASLRHRCTHPSNSLVIALEKSPKSGRVDHLPLA